MEDGWFTGWSNRDIWKKADLRVDQIEGHMVESWFMCWSNRDIWKKADLRVDQIEIYVRKLIYVLIK